MASETATATSPPPLLRTLPRTPRRTPQRPRGELRVAAVLDAAAAVIEAVGYDAATMTEIARRAGSSIGTVYQYYGDKTAIAEALRERYGRALAEELGGLADRAAGLPVGELVAQFVAIATAFTSQHPALLVVLSVSPDPGEHESFRRQLRERLARLFQRKATGLSDAEAYRVATVALQILKAAQQLTAEAAADEKAPLRAEMTSALTLYLETALGSGLR